MQISKIKSNLYILCLIIAVFLLVAYTSMLSFNTESHQAALLNFGSVLTDCHDPSSLDFEQISMLHQLESPAVYLISPKHEWFSVGTVCLGLVVYIPDDYGRNASHGLQVDDYPPDAVYLDIIGNDFQVVPKTEPSFTQVQVKKGLARYYQLSVNFRDSDDYYITGYLECK